MFHYEGLLENERQSSKWRLDFAVLLSMAVCFVTLSKMAGPILPQCSSGGKAISWWCLCSSAQHGGNILLRGIRWRRKNLPQCKTWRVFVFAACIFWQVLPQGQYGRPCHADFLAVCHVDVVAGVFARYILGGLCCRWACPIVKDGGYFRVSCGKVKDGMVSVGLLYDLANQTVWYS